MYDIVNFQEIGNHFGVSGEFVAGSCVLLSLTTLRLLYGGAKWAVSGLTRSPAEKAKRKAAKEQLRKARYDKKYPVSPEVAQLLRIPALYDDQWYWANGCFWLSTSPDVANYPLFKLTPTGDRVNLAIDGVSFKPSIRDQREINAYAAKLLEGKEKHRIGELTAMVDKVVEPSPLDGEDGAMSASYHEWRDEWLMSDPNNSPQAYVEMDQLGVNTVIMEEIRQAILNRHPVATGEVKAEVLDSPKSIEPGQRLYDEEGNYLGTVAQRFN